MPNTRTTGPAPLARRLLGAALITGLIVVPLSGCAPEPGDAQPGGGKPSLTEKQEPEGESWPEKAPAEAYEKQVEVPADFPAEFVIPEGAVVDNVGVRDTGTWFLVLRAEDETAGNALWESVIQAAGFTSNEGPEPIEGGKTATLSSPALEVEATMFPEGSQMLLSYDITPLLA